MTKENSIQEMGQYLLKGWILTNWTCTKCNYVPLLKDPKSDHAFCVDCDREQPSAKEEKTYDIKYVEEEKTAEIEMANEAEIDKQLLDEINTYETRINSTENQSLQAEQDRISSLLGDKMLQGWTLLGDQCPMCQVGVPLVQNKEKKKYCVNCISFLGESKKVTKQEKKKESQVIEQSATLPVLPPPTKTSGSSDEVVETIESLKKSLMNLKNHLNSIPATSIEEISRTCQAIHHCAAAIAECNRLI